MSDRIISGRISNSAAALFRIFGIQFFLRLCRSMILLLLANIIKSFFCLNFIQRSYNFSLEYSFTFTYLSLFYELIFFLKIDEEDEDEDEEDDDMDNLKRILGTFIQTTRTSVHSPRLTSTSV